MIFKPNKHELYLFNREKERRERNDRGGKREREIERERERERERETERKFRIDKNFLINVKYKEISWRVRRKEKKVISRSTE